KEYHLQDNDVRMVYNGIDLSKCLVKNYYSVGQTLKILHIGRFTEAKNHMLMIDTVKKLVNEGIDVRLSFVGDGTLINDCKEKVKEYELNDRISFLGLSDNVFPIMRDADVFILPSIWEGMPMTLIEAMGTGLPIVAADVGGIPDMLKKGEEALLINPCIDELSESIKRLAISEELRSKLGKNALLRSVEFSSDIMAKKYICLYEELKNGLI
ncbi:MAG: glycosyltransferase, partial [Christensenellales bacterium]